jgi:tRNA threonylcarbamoyladenosine biosynthesis protein TsaE
MNKFITKNFKETQKLGEELAKEIKNGTVVALYGDLGSGKTTFTQGFAKGFGIKKRLISPTFIIMRTYQVTINNKQKAINKEQKPKIQEQRPKTFYHVDLYRIQTEDDIRGIGLDEIIKNDKDIVVIEWAEKLGKLLPKEICKVYFKYLDEDRREIIII